MLRLLDKMMKHVTVSYFIYAIEKFIDLRVI